MITMSPHEKHLRNKVDISSGLWPEEAESLLSVIDELRIEAKKWKQERDKLLYAMGQISKECRGALSST